MAQIGELTIGYKNDEASLKAATNQMQNEFAKAGQQSGKNLETGVNSGIQKVNQSIQGLKNLLIGAFSVTAITNAVKGLFNYSAAAEQAKASFTTLLGSQEKALETLQRIDQFAAKTPFNSIGVQGVTQQLIAFGFTGDQALATINALGEGISAASKPGEDLTVQLQGVALAVGQIQAKGKLSAEELLQLTERNIPAMDILKEKLNLSQKEIENIGNAGIKSDVAIKALLEGLNERFGGNLEKQSQTIGGIFSNIVDTVERSIKRVGEGSTNTIKSSLLAIGALIEKFGPDVVNGFVLVINAIGSVFKVVGPVIIKQLNTISETFGKVVTSIAGDSNDATSALTGDRRDFFLIFSLGIQVIGGVSAAVMRSIVGLFVLLGQTVFGVFDFMQKGGNVTANLILQAFRVASLSIGVFFENMAKSVITAISGLLTNIKGGLNNFIDGINSVIPDEFKINFKFDTKGIEGLDKPTAIQKSLQAATDDFNKAKTALGNQFKSSFGGAIKEASSLSTDIVNITNSTIANLEETNLQAQQNKLDRQNEAFKKGLDDKTRAEIKSIEERKKAQGQLSQAEEDRLKRLKANIGDTNSNSLTDLDAIFGKLDNSARKAGSGTAAGMVESKKAIDDAKDSASKFESGVKKLETATQNYAEKSTNFYNEIKNDIDETNAKIKDSQTEYDKLTKQIEAGATEKQKENLVDFVKAQVSDQADTLEELKKLKEEISKEQIKTADTSSEQETKQQKLNDLDKERLEIEQKIEDIKKNIAAATQDEGAKKSLQDAGLNVDQLLAQAQERAGLSDTGRQLFDFNAEQKAIEDEKNAKLKAEQEKFNAEQENLKKRAFILDFFNKGEIQAAAIRTEQDKALFQQSLEAKLGTFNAETLAFFQKLIDQRIALQKDLDAKVAMEQQLTNAKIDLSNKATEIALINGKAVRDDVQATITKINEAIAALARLRSSGGGSFGGAREFGGPVAVGNSYLVGEAGPEIFTPSQSGQIIPNVKTLLGQVVGGTKPTITTTRSSNSSVDKSIKIDKIDVKNGRDFLDLLDVYKRRNK